MRKLLTLCLLMLTLTYYLFSNQPANNFAQLFKERLVYIIAKEYSINKMENILVGIVNYPQWFVSMSTGLYHSSTFHKNVKGSEGLYPTNITHDRWMYNFVSHTAKDISICGEKIKGWAGEDQTLELVMYSQAINVCLSSTIINMGDNPAWYNTCWLGYSKRCSVDITMDN